MQLSIARWGNSLALRLPSHLARETRIEEGSTVTVEVSDGRLILTPSRKRFSLDELLATVPARAASAEVDWGEPKGGEAW